jgi:multidrug resistance efflux pump
MSAQLRPADSTPLPSPLAQTLDAWRQRLASAGLACRAVALHAEDTRWTCGFPEGQGALAELWASTRARVTAENPVALAKVEGQAANELLMATALPLPPGGLGIVGVVLGPPHHERMVPTVMLALGWLQLALAASSLEQNRHAARLLELLGHVVSQTSARAAAQEWINRTAAWARTEGRPADGAPSGFSLALFEMRGSLPRWWVSADLAWAEKASPALQQATEAAARAAVELREVRQPPWWALPLLHDGEPAAVLVAGGADAELPDEALAVLRASAALAEPLLRQWREAERGLIRHGLDATRSAWRKLWGSGHLTWKAGAAALAVALGVLLLIPVEDRVTADTVIEGRTRHVVTAPFDGYLAQVAARPGESVAPGQLLARLDDRDLKLEHGQSLSERDEAAGKLRQAMADRDAPAMALAQAELQSAEARLALVEAKLARLDLAAPIQGLVVSGDWVQQIGSPVEAGKEMFEVATTDGWRVVLHVEDQDIARVRPGQHGVLRLAGQPHTSYPFQVTRVTATASVQDGNNGFRVEATWLGEVPPLTPGMQGVGKVEVGPTNLLTAWTRRSIDWLYLKVWSWW